MSRGIFYVASHTPLHVFGRALKHGQYDPRTASPTIGRADSAAACSRDVDSYSSHPISRRGLAPPPLKVSGSPALYYPRRPYPGKASSPAYAAEKIGHFLVIAAPAR